jgi:RsiW-degrading membrane proteinase PrsW (M82 family)
MIVPVIRPVNSAFLEPRLVLSAAVRVESFVRRQLMPLLISLAMAIAPALILVAYYYRQDRRKPEPKGLILKIFIIGILSTIPAILLELAVSTLEDLVSWWALLYYLFEAFVVAAMCEELIKLWVVRSVAYNNVHFDEVMDGIVYTIVASLGFACMENILYVMNRGWTVALLRAFTAVPMHAVCSGMMGYYIGKAKFTSEKAEESALMKKGFWTAVGIHGLYDFLLFSVPLFGIGVAFGVIPLLIVTVIALRKKIKAAISEDQEAGRS